MQPGHCSFIANPIPWQVDVLHSRVDFQCFSKGLRKKTISNHVKPERLQCDLRKHTPTGDCSSNWIMSPSIGEKNTKSSKPPNSQLLICNYIRQPSLIDRLAPEKWWLQKLYFNLIGTWDVFGVNFGLVQLCCLTVAQPRNVAHGSAPTVAWIPRVKKKMPRWFAVFFLKLSQMPRLEYFT